MASGGAARRAAAACVELVRAHDFEGFVCTLAVPAAGRGAAFAVRALNVETAQVLDAAREPRLAAMRFRWWRDALAGAFRGEPPSHPVAEALAAAAPPETRTLLERLVVAREADAAMEGAPPTLEALEAYAGGSHAAVVAAVMECAAPGGHRGPAADAAALHVGTAVGLVATLRGLLVHARSGRCYLPADVLQARGLQPQAVVAGRAEPRALAAAVSDVAAAAERHLAEARALKGDVESAARVALLPATPAGQWLDALRRVGNDVAKSPGVPPLRTQAGVAWGALTKSF